MKGVNNMKRQYIPMEPGTRELLDRQKLIRANLIRKAELAEDPANANEIMALVRSVDWPVFAK